MGSDEPMPSHVFDRLISCDPELAWELCRTYVGYQLLGREPVTIPFLDEAYHFVPFGVIVKRNKTDCSVRRETATDKSAYVIIGSMPHILSPGVDKTQFRQKPEKVHEMKFNDRYVYKTSGMKNGVKKSIKIKINGTDCYDVSITMELGKLLLDKTLPELNDVKKIFVIYEVYYAQSVSVSVTIGEKQPGTAYLDTSNRKFSHERRMPIGFSAQKFPVMANGCVGFLEKTSLDGLREGKWKRVSRLRSDPLPTTPLYSSVYSEPGSINNRRLASRRNPRDLLPGAPGSSKNDPLPPVPVHSSSSSN